MRNVIFWLWKRCDLAFRWALLESFLNVCKTFLYNVAEKLFNNLLRAFLKPLQPLNVRPAGSHKGYQLWFRCSTLNSMCKICVKPLLWFKLQLPWRTSSLSVFTSSSILAYNASLGISATINSYFTMKAVRNRLLTIFVCKAFEILLRQKTTGISTTSSSKFVMRIVYKINPPLPN